MTAQEENVRAGTTEAMAFCSAETPTVWSRLGFGTCLAPRPDELELADGWAPSWLCVETRIKLDWKDRLRILFSGSLMVDQVIKTDVSVGRSQTCCVISVLPP